MNKGKIVRGQGLGKLIGFPTLNVLYDGDERGVFAGRFVVNGKAYLAAIHIGKKLTINKDLHTCEAYLIDYEGGNVDEGVEVKFEFLHKIRVTKRFENIDVLKKNISNDVKEVKDWCVKNNLV